MKSQFNLSEALQAAGFSEVPNEIHACKCIILKRNFSKEIEVAWYGKSIQTYAIEVFINLDSSICRAEFSDGGKIIYKQRWYDTIGKRTYNAIVETARCAGFKF